MAIQIEEERSMFREPVARRFGSRSLSSHQELIPRALPTMDLNVSGEHQIDNMYGTPPYPLIGVDDVRLIGANHVPQDGKISQQDVANFLGTSGGLGYDDAICGNHALMGDTIPSENTPMSKACAEEDATTYNQRGQWTVGEDSLLKKHVKKLGEKKWSEIAKNLPGRIGKQCRERWFNHLSPEIKKTTAWTEKEEKVIVAMHRKHGNKWAKMAKRIPGRPENSIKNHWNATKRWLVAKCRSKTIATAAVRKATLSKVLEDYIRGLIDSGELKVEGAPASATADPPVLDLDGGDDDAAASASWQVDENPVVAEPSSGSNSSPDDQWWWLRMLCDGTLPPPVMEATEPTEDFVYATYDADGYVRYVHLQPTPGHSYAPDNQAAAAAAAGYYNPLPFYNPFGGQQVHGHATYPAGSYHREAGPNHRYINNGAGGDEANGDAGFAPAFSANAPAGQNQRGGGAI